MPNEEQNVISDQRLQELFEGARVNPPKTVFLDTLVGFLAFRTPRGLRNKFLGLDEAYSRLSRTGNELTRVMCLTPFEGVIFRQVFVGRVFSTALAQMANSNPFVTREVGNRLFFESQQEVDSDADIFIDGIRGTILGKDPNINEKNIDAWASGVKRSGLVIGSIFAQPKLPASGVKELMARTVKNISDLRRHSPAFY